MVWSLQLQQPYSRVRDSYLRQRNNRRREEPVGGWLVGGGHFSSVRVLAPRVASVMLLDNHARFGIFLHVCLISCAWEGAHVDIHSLGGAEVLRCSDVQSAGWILRISRHWPR